MEKIIYAIVATNGSNDDTNNLVKKIQGIAGTNLYALSYNDISVAVSDFAPSKFTITKEMAIDFARVIEALAQQFTLLPIRFGTFLKSDEIISQLLSDHYSAFVDNLKKVAGKHEFGLKLIWDYEKCSAKISAKLETEELNAGKYFTKSTVNTNYLFEKMKKHRLEDAVLKHVEQLIEEISRYLSQLSPECKFKKMLSQKIILDGVFLVSKNQKDAFIGAIEALKQQHDDLHFLLTGPWPPYSFVEILINE